MIYSYFLQTVHKRLYPTIMLPSSASLSSSLTNPSIVSPLFIVAGFSPLPHACRSPNSFSSALCTRRSPVVFYFLCPISFFSPCCLLHPCISLILSLYLSLFLRGSSSSTSIACCRFTFLQLEVKEQSQGHLI